MQSVYTLSALYWAFYCARKFEDLVPELRADRRSRLSNAAAAVWPTDSLKLILRFCQYLPKKYFNKWLWTIQVLREELFWDSNSEKCREVAQIEESLDEIVISIYQFCTSLNEREISALVITYSETRDFKL